jgi:tRNA G18 (ribose-2'-O)-methylase SpoU
MLVLVLHNIRSAHNVGSMFRTADGAGVGRIILSGYTPDHLDPKGRERPDFAKVALGAQNFVPYSREPELKDAIAKLKAEGYTVLAIELAANATNIFDYRRQAGEKLAIVLGNEVDGIAPADLALCDKIIAIPMRGKKESLNVSVACGIALFTLLK